MKNVETLRNLDQIKAVSQEYRLRILEAFQEGSATAKQISDRLGEPHAKVNYHIKALVRVGILRLAEETVRMGIVEKYYRPVARSFRVDSTVMNVAEFGREHAGSRMVEMVLEAAQLYDLDRSLDARCVADLHLTAEEAVQLQQRMQGLMEEYSRLHSGAEADTELYLASVLIAPRVRE